MSIIICLVIVLIGLGYLFIIKPFDKVVEDIKKPSKKSYILSDLDLLGGDLALVIIDRERKIHLVEDDDLIREHQGKLRMTMSFLSFLPGHVNRESGIYVFKDRKLIFEKSFRMLKVFEVGNLLDNSLPVHFRSESGTPTEIENRVQLLSKEEGVYFTKNGLEALDFKEPGKDYFIKIFGKPILVEMKKGASENPDIDKKFKTILRTHIAPSLLQSGKFQGLVSYSGGLEEALGISKEDRFSQYGIYTPAIEIYGNEAELNISLKVRKALLGELDESKNTVLNNLLESKRGALSETEKSVIESFKSNKSKIFSIKKREVYINYYKRGLE